MPKLNWDVQYKFDTFVKQHPECKIMAKEAIISIMMDNKYITQSEADILSGASVANIKTIIESDKHKLAELNNLKINKKNESINTKSIIKKPVKSHNQFKDIIVEQFGRVESNQFEIGYLKTLYPSYKYSINVKNNFLTIVDKKTKELVVSVKYPDGVKNNKINYTVFDKHETRSYNIENNMLVNQTITNEKDIIIVEVNNNAPVTIKKYRNNETGEAYKLELYYKDRLFETDYLKEENKVNHFSNELRTKFVKMSKEKTQASKKIFDTFLYTRLDGINIFKVLCDYMDEYNSDLIDDIINNPSISEKDKTVYINHLHSLMNINESFSEEESGEYLSRNIFAGVKNNNIKQIERNVLRITKDNIASTAEKFYAFLVPKRLYNYSNSKEQARRISLMKLYRGMVDAISSNLSIPEKTRKTLLNHLDKCIEKIQSDKSLKDDYNDILAEIKQHKKNPVRLDVDLVRMSARNVRTENIYTKPNGKLDEPFNQGAAGDCWLLASIMAMLNTQGGKELLESMLEYDKKTGNVTVNLKNANKKYTITPDEISNATYISQGDGDIRAIEIAFDKYIKEEAYNLRSLRVDIQGNYAQNFFKVFLEDCGNEEFDKIQHKDFNNKHYAYTLATGDKKFLKECLAYDIETGEAVPMIKHHVYTIIKSDDNLLYIENPHNTTNIPKNSSKKRKILRIERSKLLSHKIFINWGKVP